MKRLINSFFFSGKKNPCFAVGLFIFDEATKKVMFSCTDPSENQGKIRVEFMHTTFFTKKVVNEQIISEMTLKTFNSYLNPMSEEFEISKLKILDIEDGSLLCHIVVIPYERVRFLAYDKLHCMQNFEEFRKSKIKLKDKKNRNDPRLGYSQINYLVSTAFESLLSENLQKIA